MVFKEGDTVGEEDTVGCHVEMGAAMAVCFLPITLCLSVLSNPSLPVHIYNAVLFSYLFVSQSPSKLCPGGALTFHNLSCLSKHFAKENIFSLERNNVSPLGAEAAAVSSSFKITFFFSSVTHDCTLFFI